MGTMTAGDDGGGDIGYVSPSFAAQIFTSPAGSITGASTAYGTIEGLATNSGQTYLILSSPVGTPTAFYIGPTGYSLSFFQNALSYDWYTVDAYPGFSNGVVYNWSFTPSSTYTLSADGGSFALTGGSLNFLRSRVLPLAGGSFTLTGGAATFNRGFGFSLSGGAYTLQGGDLGPTVQRLLSLAGGAFTLTGGTASFIRGYNLAMPGGEYVFNGGDLNFRYNFLPLDGGDFVLTGGEAVMIPFFKSYMFTGFKGAARSAPHMRATMSPRRSTSFRSRR